MKYEITEVAWSRVAIGIIVLLLGIVAAVMGYVGYSGATQTVTVAGIIIAFFGLVIVASAKQRIKGNVGKIDIQAGGQGK